MAAVRAIHAALTDWVAAATRGDWKSASKVWAPDLVGWYPGQPVSGKLAAVRDIWRFTTAAGKPDATTSVVRGFEVWTRQPDSS
jgi:ketosteroid isomerase-like protein